MNQGKNLLVARSNYFQDIFMKKTRIVEIYQVLYGACFIIALAPAAYYFYYAISFYKIEIDALIYNVLFFLINFSPLSILNKNISRTHTPEKTNTYKMVGALCASILFIIINVTFNIIMLYDFSDGGRGSSTSGIAYVYLPILSYVAVGIGFLVGKLGAKSDQGRHP